MITGLFEASDIRQDRAQVCVRHTTRLLCPPSKVVLPSQIFSLPFWVPCILLSLFVSAPKKLSCKDDLQCFVPRAVSSYSKE